MRNRTAYREYGLVFSNNWEFITSVKRHLGEPIHFTNLRAHMDKIANEAKVKRINFHGLRHTCATLLLKARIPVPVVKERLGHSSVQITMDLYQHVLPSMQEEAANELAKIIFG